MKFWPFKKPVEAPVQPAKSMTLELEFHGTNGKVLKYTHKHVRYFSNFEQRVNKLVSHTIHFKDGSLIGIQETENMTLMNWKLYFE